jgi:hypothetical protein
MQDASCRRGAVPSSIEAERAKNGQEFLTRVDDRFGPPCFSFLYNDPFQSADNR